MNVKSERLKKLENELQDLQQWLKLGLVPKKDLEKHRTVFKIVDPDQVQSSTGSPSQ